MSSLDSITVAQVRRIALAAQGFTDPRPDRPAADRLGQRAAAGPLPARVQPPRGVPDRPARPIGLPRPPGPVRVLGPRGVAAAGGAAAGPALADGRGPRARLGPDAADRPGLARPGRLG